MGQEASHRHQERRGGGGREKETRDGVMGQARGPSGRLPPDLKGRLWLPRERRGACSVGMWADGRGGFPSRARSRLYSGAGAQCPASPGGP